ncbi:hypothetical protein ACF0H5_004702 [Mactra antiquata]
MADERKGLQKIVQIYLVILYGNILVFSLTYENSVIDVEATRFGTAVLPCTVIPAMDEEYSIYWDSEKDGQLTNGTTVVSQDGRYAVDHPSDNVWNLEITNVQTWDSGKYYCTDTPFSFSTVNLTVLYIPESERDFSFLNESTTMSMSIDQPPSTDAFDLSMTTGDPDSCSGDSQCQNGGTCLYGNCTCSPMYEGTWCEDMKKCPVDFCNQNGTVNNNCTVSYIGGEMKYTCMCKDSYLGDKCDEYDYCTMNPCHNNGTCTYHNDGYTCSCMTGEEKQCKLNDANECMQPGASEQYITCIDYIGYSTLVCAPGYKGERVGCLDSEDGSLYCNRYDCMVDEGYCKPYCNYDLCNGTMNCAFTADPFSTAAFRDQPSCTRSFADGFADAICNNEEALYDGFDEAIRPLKDCSPYFSTVCTEGFGNGVCNPVCNNTDCLYDGFDCSPDLKMEDKLSGKIVVELTKVYSAIDLHIFKNRVSMLMRSQVDLLEPISSNHIVLSVARSNFTSIEYAGKFLAASIGKRIELFDVHVKDVFVCSSGTFSPDDKCTKQCDNCAQRGNVCDWINGKCIEGCNSKYWGPNCTQCNAGCIDEGDVCDSDTGNCLHGCLPKFWGEFCDPCNPNCKEVGDVCHSETGACLNGCQDGDFFGSHCEKCPLNCDGACDEQGHCITCISGKFGKKCETDCDISCTNICDKTTGSCICGPGKYWHQGMCKTCGIGCKDNQCEDTGNCVCKPGYYGNMCKDSCNVNCVDETCDLNGHCDAGCVNGFYGSSCTMKCPKNCVSCSGEGHCGGKCKPGYIGSTCEETTGNTAKEATDNTGLIVGIVLALLLIAIIIGVACCYWRRRQSGDLYIADEDMENVPEKDSNVVVASPNSGMQPPNSPFLATAGDMIDMDEGNQTVVYAGPNSVNKESENSADTTKNDEENPVDEKRPLSESSNKSEDGGKGRCTSSVIIEVGNNGRVLSISDGDEAQSPVTTSPGATIGTIEDVEDEKTDDEVDDNAFVEPQSPLLDSKAPLASEEDLLSNLGPKSPTFSSSDQPVTVEILVGDQTENDNSKRSSKRSNSTSSSSSSDSKDSKNSKSSKSSKSDGEKEKTTEM